MRLIDADELMEHVWRDKLDSRELIAKMVDNAPTVKEHKDKILKVIAKDRNDYTRECERRISTEQGKIIGAGYMLQRFLDILGPEDQLEQEAVLDKIVAEISGMYRVILEGTPEGNCAIKWNDCLDKILQIIDKYRVKSKEDEE